MISDPQMIKYLLVSNQEDFEKSLKELEDKRKKAKTEIQSICPHNLEEPVDESFEHPHNGSYSRIVYCRTCGSYL